MMKLVDVSCEKCQANMDISEKYKKEASAIVEYFQEAESNYPFFVTCPACNTEYSIWIEFNRDEFMQAALSKTVDVAPRGVHVGGNVTGNIVTGDNTVTHTTVVHQTTVREGDDITISGDFKNSKVTIKGEKY